MACLARGRFTSARDGRYPSGAFALRICGVPIGTIAMRGAWPWYVDDAGITRCRPSSHVGQHGAFPVAYLVFAPSEALQSVLATSIQLRPCHSRTGGQAQRSALPINRARKSSPLSRRTRSEIAPRIARRCEFITLLGRMVGIRAAPACGDPVLGHPPGLPLQPDRRRRDRLAGEGPQQPGGKAASAIEVLAANSFRRCDRLHWLQPQGSPQRLVIVDHGRFIAAIEHVCLRP